MKPAVSFVPPMLAKLVGVLPEGPEWEYEVKLDGYRLEAVKTGEKVRLYSRCGNDFTKKFARIAGQVEKMLPTNELWVFSSLLLQKTSGFRQRAKTSRAAACEPQARAALRWNFL